MILYFVAGVLFLFCLWIAYVTYNSQISVKNHESDPSISCEVDPSFVPKKPDHLEQIFNMNTYFCVPYYYLRIYFNMG